MSNNAKYEVIVRGFLIKIHIIPENIQLFHGMSNSIRITLHSKNIIDEAIIQHVDNVNFCHLVNDVATNSLLISEDYIKKLGYQFYVNYLVPTLGEYVKCMIYNMEMVLSKEVLQQSEDVESISVCRIKDCLKTFNWAIYKHMPAELSKQDFNKFYLNPALKEFWTYIKEVYHKGNTSYSVQYYTDEDNRIQLKSN